MSSRRRASRIFSVIERVASDVVPISSARIAAAIVYKGDIISLGTNQKKSHPFQAKYGKNPDCIYLHAEVDAIKNSLRHITVDDLPHAELYIARMKRPEPRAKYYIRGLCKPCEGCAKAIAAFGIKKVYYTCDDGSVEQL
jgi:deoxycytidylate deaminase